MSKPELTSRTLAPMWVAVGVALLATFLVLFVPTRPFVALFTLDSDDVGHDAQRVADARRSRHEQFMEVCEPALQESREAWLKAGVDGAKKFEHASRLWLSLYLYEMSVVRGHGSPDTDFAKEMLSIHSQGYLKDRAAGASWLASLRRTQQCRRKAEEAKPIDLGIVAGLQPPPDLRVVAAHDEPRVTRLAAWIRANWPGEIGYRASVPIGVLQPGDDPVRLVHHLGTSYSGRVGVVLPRRALLGQTTLHVHGGYALASAQGAYASRAAQLEQLQEGDLVIVEVTLRAMASGGTGPWLDVVDGRLEVLGLRADVRVVDF